jgi:dephospho-CoA kinase
MPLIIGVVGRNGSGKDELVKYLERRCSIVALSAGDVARDIASQEGLAATRENLHEVSQSYIRDYGKDFFMSSLIAMIERNGWTTAAINGIRTPADVATLREHFGVSFLLVGVEVGDPAIRFERTKRRNETRDPETFEDFLEEDRREEDMFKIGETLKKADLMIRNDSTLQDFHRRIEKTIIDGLLAGEVPCR